jgi:hypothetical protein
VVVGVVWTGVVFFWVVAGFFVVWVVFVGVVGVVWAAFFGAELPQPAIAAAAIIASSVRFIGGPPGSFGRLRFSRWYTVLPESAPWAVCGLLYNRRRSRAPVNAPS